jgi:hypothetical protein
MTTIFLSEKAHPDSLLIGMERNGVVVGRRSQYQKTAHMTDEWFNMFRQWITDDGHAGKLRDFMKCDLQHWD